MDNRIAVKRKSGPKPGSTLRAPSFLPYQAVASALGEMRDQTGTAGSVGVRMKRGADFVSRALLDMVAHGSARCVGPNRFQLTGKLIAGGGIQPRSTRGKEL